MRCLRAGVAGEEGLLLDRGGLEGEGMTTAKPDCCDSEVAGDRETSLRRPLGRMGVEEGFRDVEIKGVAV